MFYKSILAIVALSTSTAFAADVYSTFYGETGAISPNFDVANTGCFGLDNADSVQFSQAGGSHFNGPYCLSAWPDAGCPGYAPAVQQFASLDAGVTYKLNEGIVFQTSYRWSPNAC